MPHHDGKRATCYALVPPTSGARCLTAV